MKIHKNGPTLISPEAVIAEFRKIADLAEASGDRSVVVKALKLAWRVENRRPANPVPPSIDRMVALSEACIPLVQRFAPEGAARLEAQISGSRRYQLELALLESETATVH